VPFSLIQQAYGRGGGVGRTRAVGATRGVGVNVAVAVAVAVAVTVAVAVGVGWHGPPVEQNVHMKSRIGIPSEARRNAPPGICIVLRPGTTGLVV
jgi:hypothetical protein